MDASKIIRLVAVLVAVLAAFITIPGNEAAVIAVLGLVGGYFVEEDRATAFLVMTLALGAVNGALGDVWYIGSHLSNVLGSLSSLLNAAACTVITLGIYNRVKP
jgi:hypothetical protein